MLVSDKEHTIKDSEKDSMQLLNIAAKGSIVAFGGSIAGRVFSLFLQIAISRWFGAGYFGILVTAIIICQFFQILGALGLGKGGLYYFAIAVERRNYKELPSVLLSVILCALIPAVLSGLILYNISSFISVSLFHNNDLAPVLKTISVSIPFIIQLRILSELSLGFKTTKYSVVIQDVFFPLLQLIIFFILYFLGYGFVSVIYAFVAGSILSALIILLIVIHQIRVLMIHEYKKAVFSENFFTLPWKEILSYSLPFIPIGLSIIGYNYIDIIMLNVFSSNDDVGYFAAASRIVLIISMIAVSVNKIFAPLIASLYGVNNKKDINVLYEARFRWMIFINLPIFILIFTYCKQVMMVFGGDFALNSPQALIILSLGSVFVTITGGVGVILTMTENQKIELIAVIAGLILNIGLNLYLIPLYGIIGAAFATTISKITVNFLEIVILCIMFKIRPITNKNIVLILFTIFIYLLHSILIKANWGSGFIQYFGIIAEILFFTLIFAYGLEKEDYKILVSIKNKIQNVYRI